MLHIRLISIAPWFLMLAMVATGCPSSNQGSAKQHRERGAALVEKQQFREALTEYEEAVKLDPKDDEAYYQMALVYFRQGTPHDVELAHMALQKVVKINSSRVDARVQLAQLYFLAGQADQAGQQADAILAINPVHADAHLIKGLSLVAEGRTQNGIAELRKAIELDPQKPTGYIELARVYAQQRNFTDAEALLRESLQRNPQSSDSRILLGDVLAAAGKETEAAKEYQRGLEADRNNGTLYMRLAALHHKAHRTDEAERWYRQWIDAQPKIAEAHVALARFYFATGKWKQAESSYKDAKEIDPSSRFVREALITFYLDTNRITEAGVEIESLLQKNQKDLGARILHARWTIEQGDLEKAESLLQELAHEAPKMATVHQYLGIAAARHQDYPKAISALKEAEKLAPNSSEIHANLAQIYLAQRSLSLAIKEGETAIALNPQNADALKTLADASLVAGETKRAEELLKTALTVSPHDATIHQRLGVIDRLQRRPAEALAHFEQAFQENPKLIEALEQIAAVLVSQGKATQARERVERQLAMNSEDPRLHNLLGKVLMQSQKYSEAEAAYKKAILLDGTLLVSYANLGELYTRQGKLDQAIKEFEGIHAKNPRELSTLMTLGLLHEQRKDFAQAAAKYEEILTLNANFAPAANNLAWILLEHDGDKERALSYAETAWKASPHDAHIVDTLGWAYFKKQMYGKAAGLLKEAVEKLPEDPVVLYHYGMAQYWNDNNAEAKKSLKKFLTLSPNSSDAGEARKVLAAL
jgi:tetratricopeptide (TPR) repeat protein